MIDIISKQTLSSSEMERIIWDYKDKLLRMCFLYLKDRSLAEDALQDTFLKIYKSYASFDKRSSEKTWVMRIAINVCKNYRREFWYRRITSSEALEMIPADDTTKDFEDNSSLTAEVLNLSPKYREVVLLYYYQELKMSEIASVLSLTESAVSVRLKRAREQLKKKLKGWYYGE